MRNFNHTMDILVKAYFNDTLVHGNCHACAIGNMVAGNVGLGFKNGRTHVHSSVIDTKIWEHGEPKWQEVFGTFIKDGRPVSYNRFDNPDDTYLDSEADYQSAMNQSEATGYAIKELARIERAFETSSKGSSDEDWMFNGLMAVLEVLADIHGVDLDGKKVFENQLVEIHATR